MVAFVDDARQIEEHTADHGDSLARMLARIKR
jgi:hypothetical protein